MHGNQENCICPQLEPIYREVYGIAKLHLDMAQKHLALLMIKHIQSLATVIGKVIQLLFDEYPNEVGNHLDLLQRVRNQLRNINSTLQNLSPGDQQNPLHQQLEQVCAEMKDIQRHLDDLFVDWDALYETFCTE